MVRGFRIIFFRINYTRSFWVFLQPNYNSVVSTFCHKIINNEITNVIDDKEIKLIYIDDLINLILDLLNNFSSNKKIIVKYNKKIMVSQLLEIIKKLMINM